MACARRSPAKENDADSDQTGRRSTSPSSGSPSISITSGDRSRQALSSSSVPAPVARSQCCHAAGGASPGRTSTLLPSTGPDGAPARALGSSTTWIPSAGSRERAQHSRTSAGPRWRPPQYTHATPSSCRPSVPTSKGYACLLPIRVPSSRPDLAHLKPASHPSARAGSGIEMRATRPPPWKPSQSKSEWLDNCQCSQPGAPCYSRRRARKARHVAPGGGGAGPARLLQKSQQHAPSGDRRRCLGTRNRRAYELRDTLTACGATFVALAETLSCNQLTADQRLSKAPGPRCPIRLLL